MCGFIGALGLSGSAPDLRKGLPFLERRGPDAQRVWSSSDGRAALLHARLSIVDFDGRAHQPMSDATGTVTVAFIGEIYNYREVRGQLKSHAFRTESDTEVLLAAYLARGVAGLRLLKGMFALAIVDERSKRIVLARDPVGKKPLFVGRAGGAVLFGCTVCAMAAAAGVAADLDREGIGDYVRNGWAHPTRCALDGFVPLPPGTVIELDWDGRERARTDCRPAAGPAFAGEAERDVRKRVEALLRGSVQRRLTNNPNPTVLLSGGIDSTVVTSETLALCRANDLPLQVLTLGSLIPWRNDEPHARYAARRLGLRATVLRIPLRDLAARVLSALDAQDEPLGMIAYFTLFELVRAAKAHGRILLTGDGGDEFFLGYGKAGDWLLGNSGDPGVPDGSRATPGFRSPPPEIPCGPPLPDWMSDWGRGTATAQLVGHMFAKADRASAEQGVEMRCPLLDWDLIGYARSLPHDMLTAGGRMKAQLKALLHGWPRSFLERPKVGFAFNLRYLWAASNFAGLRDCIDPRAQDVFGDSAPEPLRRRPADWRRGDIFRNFDMAWRMLALSRFLVRLRNAGRAG